MHKIYKEKEQILQKKEVLYKRNTELSEEIASLCSLLASIEDLIFILDKKGIFIKFFQRGDKKDLYAEPSCFLNKHFRGVMPPELSDKFQESLDALGASGVSQELEFYLNISGTRQWYHALVSNWIGPKDKRLGYVVVVRNITKRKQMEEMLAITIKMLSESLQNVKVLTGLLPICSVCKKIRDNKDCWNHIENYIRDHSEAEFSHSICPECARKLYNDFIDYDYPKD